MFVIKNTKIISKKTQLFKVIFAVLCFVLPTVLLAQSQVLIVTAFVENEVVSENTIIINDDFVEFRNSEIDISLSKNYQILELQFLPLGIKWSGNLNLFQNEYNDFIRITTDAVYHANQTKLQIRKKLIESNDAVLKNDSVFSFKDNYSSVSLIKTNNEIKILDFMATEYKSSRTSDVSTEIWFAYKLNKNDRDALIEINAVLQKIASVYNKTYSVNLNYLSNNNIAYFPLKVIEHNALHNTYFKEETLAYQQGNIDKNMSHNTDNYQSISLFDFLLAGKTEINK